MLRSQLQKREKSNLLSDYVNPASEYARGTFGNDKHHFWKEISKNANNWDTETPLTREEQAAVDKEHQVVQQKKAFTRKVNKPIQSLDTKLGAQ